MPVRELLDIPYAQPVPEPRQALDLFLPTHALNAPLLIFVHGGAWRTGSKSEHRIWARALVSCEDTPCAVALLDYRLSTFKTFVSTPKHKSSDRNAIHPDHIRDVHAAVRYLILDRPRASSSDFSEYKPDHVIVSGHSVGALMLCYLCFQLDDKHRSSVKYFVPKLPDTAELRKHIRAYVLIDGIYDIDDLLKEYPDYYDFVGQAFAPPGAYPQSHKHTRSSSAPVDEFHYVSLPSLSLSNEEDYPVLGNDTVTTNSGKGLPRIFILHSPSDELLTIRQSLIANFHILSLLYNRSKELSTKDRGQDFISKFRRSLEAVKVPSSKQVSSGARKFDNPIFESLSMEGVIPASESLSSWKLKPWLDVDFSTVDGTHDDMLHTDEFVKYLRNVISQSFA